jgi:ribosomal protein L23
MDIYHIIRRALITEKSTAAKDEGNKYIFEVDRRANKIEVATAVEKLFKSIGCSCYEYCRKEKEGWEDYG